MKTQPSGDFAVEPQENITFSVTRKDSPCKVSFDCQGWQSCTPVTSPDVHSKTKTCTATALSGSQSTCSITVDFRNDSAGTYDPGDQYAVTIAGSKGGSYSDTFTPPPTLSAQTYVFSVE